MNKCGHRRNADITLPPPHPLSQRNIENSWEPSARSNKETPRKSGVKLSHRWEHEDWKEKEKLSKQNVGRSCRRKQSKAIEIYILLQYLGDAFEVWDYINGRDFVGMRPQA